MEEKARIFEFTSYQFEPARKRAVFHYTTKFGGGQAIHFTETLLLPAIPDVKEIPAGLLKKMLESLHLMLGISYYKFYPVKYREAVISPNAKLFNQVNCAPDIKIPYSLSRPEADFWNTVYKKGLGEFFYRNKLDPKISPKFPFQKSVKTTNYQLQTTNSNCLIGMGGGKESIVTAELLKGNPDASEAGSATSPVSATSPTAFHVETGRGEEIIENVIKTAGLKSLKVRRFLDPKVHQPHPYNGHIPISAVYAFLGVFAALLYKYSYFIVGNEHSSNFSNIAYRGLEVHPVKSASQSEAVSSAAGQFNWVNHQWSKSFEFETLFQDYVKKFLTPDVKYFSLLRPFYEIRIAKMFSKQKKYFPHFSSCNANFKINQEAEKLWCGQCAKCLFVFIMLSAFLSKKELIGIFGQNLYQQENLLPLFKDVLGFGTMKPFDCVGTFEEAQTALFLAKKNFGKDFIVRQLCDKTALHRKVFLANNENAVPEQFRFLGMESIYILGYGKEGKATKQYLKKYYPKLKIGLGDEKLSKDYLKNQKNYDIAIKSPGIKKELVRLPYTTATNIFFSELIRRRASGAWKGKTIGVTGSKGKSTTASLIFEILKADGKKVELLGNIGNPMLERLLKPVDRDVIFVLELSSQQLDDIAFSSDIAVVTNLFPEHMDYHGNVENYYNAKKNIINFQASQDFLVYNQKIIGWLKGYKGKPVKFAAKKYESNLIGKHNQSNIGAAAAVAEILKIPQFNIQKAVKSFKGLPHRLEFIGEFKGIKFYDDAISTTPESTIMAVQSLKNIGTIFLGGQDRGYDFSDSEKTLKKYKIKNIVLFPDSGGKMFKSTAGLNMLKTKSMQKAVVFAFKHTKRGEVCLLSCASPSYSLWKNFEEKGDEFKKFVKKFSR